MIGVGGVGLSVGQRQRLALTRALAAHSQVVILDEPTAHLDAVSEKTIVRAITTMRDEGRTVIVIAHRNAIIEVADTIIDVVSADEEATGMRLFLTRSESAALRRCISMLNVSRSGFALSLLLGVTALGSAIALGGTAAWLIARASQQPPVLYLTVAATSVRLFGVSRALARYLSRLASHKVALAGMDALRGNLYDRLCEEPAASLTSLRRGDL